MSCCHVFFGWRSTRFLATRGWCLEGDFDRFCPPATRLEIPDFTMKHWEFTVNTYLMNVFSLSQLQHMGIPAAKKIFATSTWKWNHTIINRLLFICWKRMFSCARLYCRWVARWLHPSWGTDELHYHGTTRLRVPCSPSYFQFRTAVLVKKPSQSMTTKNWMKGRSTGSRWFKPSLGRWVSKKKLAIFQGLC